MTHQSIELPSGHPAIAPPKIGVLLVNLGTPDAPEKRAVRRYLAEFLSDPRVIEIPWLVWQPILRGIILNTRPAKSARAYAKVWSEEGSPLAAITARQARLLQQRLGDQGLGDPGLGDQGLGDPGLGDQGLGDQAMVRHAMRYGRPSIEEELRAMHAAGCQRILLAPLYPQYCAATTASVVDKAGESLRAMRWQPSLRTLPPYYDDPLYLDALEANLRRQLGALDFAPQVLLLSFHGMPQRTLELGDPYHCHCRKTARLLAERLEDTGLRIEVSFQSRFGRAKWLEPATDATLERLAQEGVERIALAAPGFAADCVETLEELAIEGRKTFLDHGGEQFALLECLNDSDEGMAMIERLVRRELGGWI